MLSGALAAAQLVPTAEGLQIGKAKSYQSQQG